MRKKSKNQKKIIVIGLTGSIGMGKSTAAKIFNSFGLSVYNADTAIHKILEGNSQTIKNIKTIFPTTIKNGKIDRKMLGNIVFNNPKELKKLEKLLHPLEKKEEQKFIKMARKSKKIGVVLEVPQLFEAGRESLCDAVICVTAPLSQQRARVLGRKGMTRSKFNKIVRLQMSSKEKKRRATYVVNTGKEWSDTKRQLTFIWNDLQKGFLHQ